LFQHSKDTWLVEGEDEVGCVDTDAAAAAIWCCRTEGYTPAAAGQPA